jgi:putative ABC transport system permease protein
MWRHCLSIAARGIVRHRLYSAINIVCLAIGLTRILFVRDESSYDRWIPDTENPYRVETTIYIPGRPPLSLALVSSVPAAMRDRIPGVTGATRLYSQLVTLTSGDKQLSQRLDVVDPNFFEVIRLPLVKGDPRSVFRQPVTVYGNTLRLARMNPVHALRYE